MKENSRSDLLPRLVIKIGTAALLNKKRDQLSQRRLKVLVNEIVQAKKQGWQVLVVSSGAIASGIKVLGLKERPQDIPTKQAAAAIGQAVLMQTYQKLFDRHQIKVGQVLLTRDDFSSRSRFVNASNTLNKLLQLEVVPIINENDTVAVDEIKVGDNDTLAALVAQTVQAQKLIILSDIEGIYNRAQKDRRKGGRLQGRVLRLISRIDRQVLILGKASAPVSARGVGGIGTKIAAAQIATRAGITTVIANGRKKSIITRILAGEPVGSTFLAQGEQLSRRKKWLANCALPRGTITVDNGAEKVLQQQGKSLLAVGIIRVSGKFASGDPVRLVNQRNREFARGLANYSSEQLQLIKQRKTKEIAALLDLEQPPEAVHRDNLVILRS